MPEGQQKLESKQIQGQVITHTIVKPLPDGANPPARVESDEADTASE
ncbi:hypothetical protein GXW82_31910 [Streptacidiphilus sp. 4-A2]|nr:hypothetical protein [Streptacidiphilus sp. 4-A2]